MYNVAVVASEHVKKELETEMAEEPDELNEHENTPGHPQARGTLPMARLLTDPAVEEWIQELAASAPPMTEDQRSRLSRLLRFNRVRTERPGT
ncbi:hypothetical protein Ate02nite_84600 [Paractinoplanes tereljensis]|uniref:Uncharacterized protein n=1 Tax=Paractinoplanes tereljensis TaxID=571912 RepID=A0A919TYY3_9ACTN|nr:hypothetical protein Ate02nite_84600 [Actinoplanes tereljensis]